MAEEKQQQTLGVIGDLELLVHKDIVVVLSGTEGTRKMMNWDPPGGQKDYMLFIGRREGEVIEYLHVKKDQLRISNGGLAVVDGARPDITLFSRRGSDPHFYNETDRWLEDVGL